MQFFTIVAALALAVAAVAQTDCAAQNILDACTSQLKPQLSACYSQDWDCLCDKSTNLLTCYNNCPNDPTKSSVQNQQVQYCNAAKAYGSSASSSIMSMTGSNSASATVTGPTSSMPSPTLPAGVTASATSSTGSSNEAVATSSTINGSGTGAGNSFGPSFGGLVAVLAGAVAFL